MTIDGFTGVHMTNRTDNDVNGIWFYDTNTKYIPANIGFKSNLTALFVQNSNILNSAFLGSFQL